MIRKFRQFLQSLLAGFGYQVERDGWSRSYLCKPGFNPRVVIDVGVACGTPRLYAAFPNAYYLLVEPLYEYEPHLTKILKRLQGEYVLAAAGSCSGTGFINVEPKLIDRSSILPRTQLSATGAQVHKRKVPIKTLDEMVHERGLRGPFGVKIDTEGYELEVIRGAKAVLCDTQFLIAEVSIAPRFEGGYAFFDFVETLHKEGFSLIDVLSVARFPKARGAVFMDALFAKG